MRFLILLAILVPPSFGAVYRNRGSRQTFGSGGFGQGGQISVFNQTFPGPPGVPQGTIDQFQGAFQGGQQAFGGAAQGFFPGAPQPPPAFLPFPSNPQGQGGQGPAPGGSESDLIGRKDPEVVPIISYEFSPNPADGSYKFSYETGDGIKREESGSQKAVGEPAELGTVSQGSWSYTAPDGNLVSVSFVADENGFQPQGSHIPTPPPIPKEILAALEAGAANEAAQNNGAISPAYHYFLRNSYRQYY